MNPSKSLSVRIRIGLVISVTSLMMATLPVAGQTSDPFADPIPAGNLTVGVRKVATIPSPGNQQPPRMNLLTSPGDGSGRLFVNDQRGVLYTIDNGTAREYLDLRDGRFNQPTFTGGGGEVGFQTFAFHPQFGQANTPGYGKFYTYYATSDTGLTPDFADPQGSTHHLSVVVEWTADDPTASTFKGTARVLFAVEQPFGNHNGGSIGFNPNSKPHDADYANLYVGLGDGGSGGDPHDNAQDTDRALGKILRINPLANNSANGQYGIPADNPNLDDGDSENNDLSEIYANGFRNPERFSWDTGGNHAMFIGDIGQNVVEEIDIGQKGANYGWHQREGGFEYVSGQVRDNPTPAQFTDPVAEYDHSEGRAITAGYVYRGSAIPQLQGKLLFGDLANGRVFYIDVDDPSQLDGGQDDIRQLLLRGPNGQTMTLREMIRASDTGRADLRLGTDSQGEIYLLNKHDGVVRKLVPQPGALAHLGLVGLLCLACGRRLGYACPITRTDTGLR